MTRNKKKKSSTISEPEPVYTASLLQQTEGKDIVISTFEQQEEANYTYWLSLSPEQRLALHYKMIASIYKEALKRKKKKEEQKIIITKNHKDI